MVEAIERIQDYVAGMDATSFRSDRRTFDAVVRNLEILGEASKHIPPDLQSLYTAAPWRLIGDLRNKAIHDYSGLSPDLVWQTVKRDLPPLHDALLRMREAAG